jgi:predicted MFS family arabinose efflux permease
MRVALLCREPNSMVSMRTCGRSDIVATSPALHRLQAHEGSNAIMFNGANKRGQEQPRKFDPTPAAEHVGLAPSGAIAAHRRRTEWRIVWMMAVMLPLVVLSQFFRSSIGVIAPNLEAEFGLSSDDLGLLSGSFFFVFAGLQLPIGVLLDRFGGRLVLPSMMVLTVLGALAFAIAENFFGLLAGRLLIGVGCAGLMVGSLMILGRWCSPARFATTMSILFACANAGSLIATLPLAAATSAFGWRGTFISLAVTSGVLATAFLVVVRDAPSAHNYHRRRPESLSTIVAGVRQIFAYRDLVYLLPMVAVGYASVIAVLGLWGGPYLHDVYGLGEVARGNALSIMAIAMILGTFAYGPLDRHFNTRRGVVTAGAVATLVPLLVLAAWPGVGLLPATLLLGLFGFLGSYSLVVMAHGLALVPEGLAGRGAAVLNTALMGGAGLLQAVTGHLMAALPETRESVPSSLRYALLFGILAAMTGVALAIYRRAADVEPKDGRPPWAGHPPRAPHRAATKA